jgi:hypothetical protein
MMSLLKNPAALMMGANAIMGNRSLPYQRQLESSANAQAQQGRRLMSYIESGTLPSGLQQGLDTAAEAARTSIRSMYASRGMQGSSAQAQDLAAVGEREAAEAAHIATQLFQLGLNENNEADQLYMQLMGEQLQQDQNLSNAVANFASTMAQSAQPVVPGGGGGGGTA